MKEKLAFKDRYLLYKQFLAHGDALIEPLLVFLQEFLLLVNLSPQVTVCLLRRDRDYVKWESCPLMHSPSKLTQWTLNSP